MPRALGPIPLGTPITDRDGTITAFFRQRWQDISEGANQTGTLARLSLTAQTGPATAITRGATVTATPGPSGGTSAPIDTTGASLLVVSAGLYFGLGTAALSDSQGNPWTPLTARVRDPVHAQLWYCLAPRVGPGHTFTISGTVYPAFRVAAYAGVATYQTESGATSATSPLASGSVTPAAAGALVLFGRGARTTPTDAVTPPGFTLTALPVISGICLAATFGDSLLSTAAALNPTVTWPEAVTENTIATAVFLPATTTTTGLLTVVTAGLYRVSWYLRKTRVDGVSSSATVTIGFVDVDGVALSYAGAPLTLDSLGAWQGVTVPIRCGAPTDITVSVAYASATPGQMRYDLGAAVEFLP